MKKQFLLLSLGCLFVMCKMNGWAANLEGVPQLTVKGEASIFKPADQMEISLGVLTTGENSSVALNENNQRMHQIIANLQALGLEETDYQTGRFQIRPIYQKLHKNSYEEDRTKISHYEVTNSIQVKTQKIDLADRIIGAAVQGGANEIEQLNFSLNNPQNYRAEAIAAAAQNALADATALAKAVGVRLKRVIHLSLDHWQQYPGPMLLHKANIGGYEAVDRDAIASGRAEIHATVNVIFEID